MARNRPKLRATETYTATNFLRLQTCGRGADDDLATLEHFVCTPDAAESAPAWSCVTIVDAERMSRSDAVFIAERYAVEHAIPVIYTCHSESSQDAG
jgi:hypothetical protein